MRLRQNQQPAAEEQNLDMARFNAGIAFDERVDCIEALAEITRDQHFATAEAHHERGWGVFHTEGAVQSGNDKVLKGLR